MTRKKSAKSEEAAETAQYRGPYAEWRGPYEEMAGEPGTPVAELVITAPEEGATVPPVHDVTGTGATPGGSVSLSYGEGVLVAETEAGEDGAWGFTGDQPAAAGPQTWTVRDGDRTASVSVTVESVTRKKGW